jgi:hypothetical protein
MSERRIYPIAKECHCTKTDCDHSIPHDYGDGCDTICEGGVAERFCEGLYLTCPFCGEGDFDAEGLKYHHLLNGSCDQFNAIENQKAKWEEERKAIERNEELNCND